MKSSTWHTVNLALHRNFSISTVEMDRHLKVWSWKCFWHILCIPRHLFSGQGVCGKITANAFRVSVCHYDSSILRQLGACHPYSDIAIFFLQALNFHCVHHMSFPIPWSVGLSYVCLPLSSINGWFSDNLLMMNFLVAASCPSCAAENIVVTLYTCRFRPIQCCGLLDSCLQ